jgi:hypothetical protein
MSGIGGFLDALDKLPPSGGVLWRGLGAPPFSVPPLAVLTGLASASRNPRVATENFTAQTILVLLSRTGRDIAALSAHPEESEVIFRPGTVWRRIPEPEQPNPATPVIVLEELEPSGYTPPTGWPATLTDLAAWIDSSLRSAQADAPVTVSRPGVFTGPWPVQVVAR